MLLDLNSTPPEEEGSETEHAEKGRASTPPSNTMFLDLNSTPPVDEGGEAEHEEEGHASKDVPMPDVQDATPDPDHHWMNQARDLEVILAATGPGSFVDEDNLHPDGSQEAYEDIDRDLQMAAYTRDECFQVVCGVHKYRMRQH